MTPSAKPEAPTQTGQPPTHHHLSSTARFASVWLDFPFAAAFDYSLPADCPGPAIGPGDWVVVPWGRKRLVGIVAAITSSPAIDPERVKAILVRLDTAPVMPARWLALGRFAATYYHRQPGEIMLPGIPKGLRLAPRDAASGDPAKPPRRSATAFERARKRWLAMAPRIVAAAKVADAPDAAETAPVLTDAQRDVLVQIQAAGDRFNVHLLHGITGSGKTEVYLRWMQQRLQATPTGQVLMLVPEIALTPQLAASVARRLPMPMAILHSGLAEAERAAHWLAVAEGRARIIIGTRLAVLAAIPELVGIIVDEEHDPSFKQAEGAHYSARDLAIVMAREADVPIILGSATPALESWHSALTGRFRRHSLPRRASGASLPEIRIDPLRESTRAAHKTWRPGDPVQGLTPTSVEAIQQALQRREQVLVFINRRGYAPVLNCRHCGWLSQCEHCSAWRVLHRLPSARDRQRWRLVCHHCGIDAAVPASCPGCGDVDLQPVGQGTQRVEEVLGAAFPQARIARLDRDVARRRGGTDEVLASIHEGRVDLIIGTQMLTKGHDFRHLNLVIVLDADGGLFAADFRAPERLFATLMQVAGRAGRHPGVVPARVIIQTRFPTHPVFAALARHDFDAFASQQLAQREQASLPPFSHQALLKAQADSLEIALTFLHRARKALPDGFPAVSVYDPVPMPMARLAGRARAQLLVECAERSPLHRCLTQWLPALPASTPRLRWQMELDPADI